MVRRIGDRLSYANVMATFAVLATVMGGTAYAAATIGPKDIKPNAVLSKHLKDGQVKRQDLGKGVQGARAFVHVTRDGDGDFVVDGTRTKNVVRFELPQTGNTDRPCLVLPAWIDASTAIAIGTVDSDSTPEWATAVITHRVSGESSQGCPGNAIALMLGRSSGVASTDTISFNVMVP